MTIASHSGRQAPVAMPALKFRFYRQCRLWHGYLSAFAFVALLFFAVTGLFLNHPQWFEVNLPLEESTVALTAQQLQQVRNEPIPGEALVPIVAAQTPLFGEYKDSAVTAGQLFVRLQGARGASDLRANLSTGVVDVSVERATTIALLNALHRGESGAAWRTFIDVAAVVLIVLSLIGYAIFLSMSARLKSALLITGTSVLAIVTLFAALVR